MHCLGVVLDNQNFLHEINLQPNKQCMVELRGFHYVMPLIPDQTIQCYTCFECETLPFSSFKGMLVQSVGHRLILVTDSVYHLTMAQGGNPEVGSETPAMEATQAIFGAGNLEYQMEHFIKSGGHSVKILLSGKTGVGKSHLTNALIGEELAEEGEDVDPQTDKVILYGTTIYYNTIFLFYNNICYKNIEAEIFEILRIF